MTPRVLHVLSQRPSRTGSGITLDALVRQAEGAGWEQAAVVGVPASDPRPRVGRLPDKEIFPLTFAADTLKAPKPRLNFPLPGMSDVMPYPSSVWSQLDHDQLDQYRQAWSNHLRQAIDLFQPQLIHSNHIWLVSALLGSLAPDIPRVATCHATGLRQMELCPHLAEEVIAGCRTLDHVFALRQDHKELLVDILEIPSNRVTVSGVGFRDEVFHPRPDVTPQAGSVLYVGKFSAAKGLPWLLDSWQKVLENYPHAVLHIAGDGAGQEADLIRQRLIGMAPSVVRHGQLDQPQLAELMARCQVCVLPSFYEGVPLVLAEAAACGCRIVSTSLPGVREQLAPSLKPRMHLVKLPALLGIDTPDPADLPDFVIRLQGALEKALQQASQTGPEPSFPLDLKALTWEGVFERVENVWNKLII